MAYLVCGFLSALFSSVITQAIVRHQCTPKTMGELLIDAESFDNPEKTPLMYLNVHKDYIPRIGKDPYVVVEVIMKDFSQN